MLVNLILNSSLQMFLLTLVIRNTVIVVNNCCRCVVLQINFVGKNLLAVGYYRFIFCIF